MKTIVVLSSFHGIHGKCRPDELFRILEKLQPEVIFEELSQSTFDMVYAPGYQPKSLEAKTIKWYLESYPALHFPVDTLQIDITTLSNPTVVWNHSREYRDLWSLKLAKLGEYGFDFLNSETCSQMLHQLVETEEKVYQNMGDTRLLEIFMNERVLHDNREKEMLKNIYAKSQQVSFNKALFICGAEHRLPLQKKIMAYESVKKSDLDWRFYPDYGK